MVPRKINLIALLLLVCLFLTPLTAQAAPGSAGLSPIDTGKDCILSLSYRYDSTVFSDVPVTLYRVAEVSSDFWYTLTADFQASGLDLNGIPSTTEWDVIRTTLESYLLTHGATPAATAATNAAGQVLFQGLKPGLYLASSADAVQNDTHCRFASALIALPGLNWENQWLYQVAASPKPQVLPPVGPSAPDTPGIPEEPEEVTYQVLKLWKAETDPAKRPAGVEVELYRNGVLTQTVTLSEDNHWSYSWTVIDDGAAWTVAEPQVPEGYTVTLERRDDTFLLTNTWIPVTPPDKPTPDKPSPDSPKTGDTPHIQLYTLLMYLSGGILILLGLTGKKKRV